MAPRTHARWRWSAVSVAVASVLVLFVAAPSDGQILDPEPPPATQPQPEPQPEPPPTTDTTTTTRPRSTTTTTEPRSTTTTTLLPTTTTAPPSGDDGSPSTSAPTGSPGAGTGSGSPEDPGGEGDAGPSTSATPRSVPPDAQRIINAVRRTPANSSTKLFEAVQQLVDLGLTREEAVRVGFGRFPIAGVANYSHDWLFPRYGPGFRFHMGTDVFAPFGTPLRASVDGVLTAKTSTLGGLSVKVTTPDGTYFYYAHLSGLPDGFVNGTAVKTGDIVGYVGDSGNAKGGSPHLHLGIYPQGGAATDPKPILDQFLADALERLPGIVEQVRANAPVTAEAAPLPLPPATPRSLLATSLLRPLAQRPVVDVPTEILYQTTANPSAGGASVAQTEAGNLAARIDWEAWQTRADVGQDLLRRTEAVLRVALGPRTSTARGSAAGS